MRRVYSDSEADEFAISIHASHAGCDISLFLCLPFPDYFNPRIPCGMRRRLNRRVYFLRLISIHASHAGCDVQGAGRGDPQEQISIHASHAGCDVRRFKYSANTSISIHASHAGCDKLSQPPLHGNLYFNPRIPCGMRQNEEIKASDLYRFQSTHPMRDAT